jgi:acetyl-CoA synthetase
MTFAEQWRGFRWELPRTYNIGVDVCDRHAAHQAGATALLYEDETGAVRHDTFGHVRERSNRLANALAHRGCTRGSRVGILLPQSPEAAIAHVAIYKLGAVAVPLSTLFGPDALEYRLDDAGVGVLLTDAAGRQKLASIRDRLPGLTAVYITDDAPQEGEVGFADDVAAASAAFEPVPTLADDPALIIYTSGTTGPPKGVLHAHRTLLGHLPGFTLSHGFFPQSDDLFWTPADWAWAGGLLDGLLPTWHYGRPIVASRTNGKFDPERAFWLMEKYRVRNTFLPPTALKLMRRVPDPRGNYALRLRSLMSAGEPLGADTLAWGAETLGLSIDEMFGQTEANYIVGNCHALIPVKPSSMGVPYPGHSVEVLDADGQPVPPGTLGEIAVRRDTPVMFLEYWNKPDATRQKFRGDWMLTGDLATMDEQRYLFFRGRGDDVINSAGYRVGPAEVEDCLLKHPAVALAGVIGVPDALRGSLIKAYVQLAHGVVGTSALARDIQEHVRYRLAAYEYPRVIEFIDRIPLTTTGKIKRDELRRRSRESADTSS